MLPSSLIYENEGARAIIFSGALPEFPDWFLEEHKQLRNKLAVEEEKYIKSLELLKQQTA